MGLPRSQKRVLKIDLDKEQQRSDWSAPVLSRDQLVYAAKDVEVLLQLDHRLDEMLQNNRLAQAFALGVQSAARHGSDVAHWSAVE